MIALSGPLRGALKRSQYLLQLLLSVLCVSSAAGGEFFYFVVSSFRVFVILNCDRAERVGRMIRNVSDEGIEIEI